MQPMKLEKHYFCTPLHAEAESHIRRDLETARFSVAALPGLAKDDFLTLSYAFGEVVPPGRKCNLVTHLETADTTGEAFVPLHNDKSYWRIPPRYLLLYISKAIDVNQGHTLLSNLVTAYKAISTDDQISLREPIVNLAAPSNRDSGSMCGSVANTINGDIAFFRYRLDLVIDGMSAVSRFGEQVQFHSFPVTLNQGDLLILDNWTMAHGRTNTTFLNGGRRIAYRSLVL